VRLQLSVARSEFFGLMRILPTIAGLWLLLLPIGADAQRVEAPAVPTPAPSTHAPAARPAYTEPEQGAQQTLLHPLAAPQNLRLLTDTRAAYTDIGAAFGIKVTFDSSAPSTTLRLDLDQITFEQAMNAVALVTRTFWTPLSSHEVLVAADTPAKRKDLERWLLRTFYLPETSSPQELTEIATLLRTLFEIRSVTQSASSATITVRGPAPRVLAATRFLETFRAERPQVTLDFDVYEITRQMMHNIGITVPSQFTLFDIPQSAVAGLGNKDIEQFISRETTAGRLNQTNGPSIPALISQLQHQNSLNSLFQNSGATLDLGTTRIGIQIPPAVVNFSADESRATSLSRVTMRGSQNNPTIFRLGTRYPVVAASYISGPFSAASAPVITYVDLGVTITATPTVHQRDVTLDLDMEIASLGSELFNGIPTISHRRYKGTITVKNDEPAVVTGSLSRSEFKGLQGIPGINNLPPLGSLTTNRNTREDEDELLVIITPHIVSAAPAGESSVLLLPRD
jgi:general secretion pathway protein D